MTASRLTELAEIISDGAKKLEAYYRSRDIPTPSFDIDSPVDTVLQDPVMERIRLSVLDASVELKDRLEGPTMQLRPVLNATSLHAIYEYNLPSKVPLNGDMSYTDLSQLCGLETGLVRRIVRFAIAHHRIFQEEREGFVSHSAASKLLADSQDAMAGVAAMFTAAYPAFAQTVPALRKFPHQNPWQCGWTVANQSKVPIWEANAKDPKRAERANRAMRQFTRGFGHDTTSLLKAFEWASTIDRDTHMDVVDLGGGNGHASILLARHYPQLNFEVQDLPHIISEGEGHITPDLKHRIKWRAHDFTTPQPTKADVYLFRQIFHDWPDAVCIKILQALTPALKPGARIVLNDFLVSPPGVTSPHIERHVRAMDMLVMTLVGAKERERADWQALFAQADSRFTEIRFTQPDTCCMSVIEATWSG